MIRRWRDVVSTALALSTFAGPSVAAITYDSELCGRDEYNSPDGELVYGSNAWNPVGDGFQCVGIQNDPRAMDATWMWDADPSDVHSFPHVRFNFESLPARMSSINSMNATVQWAMYVSGSLPEPPRTFSANAWSDMKSGLDDEGVVANVAFDFFTDPNKTRVYNPVDADAEIMIWLGRLGRAQPLKGDSPLTSMKLSGVDFELYHAKNFRDHNVFTWLPADENAAVTDFSGDLAPMLEYVRTSGLIANDSWLGLAEIGTETWYSSVNVTFTAMNYSMVLDASGDDGDGDGSGNDDDNDGDGDGDNAASHLPLSAAFSTMGLAALVWTVAFLI